MDDLFVDLYYWFHHLFAKKKFNKLTFESPEQIHEIPEKPVAIFTPAWHEHEVIDKMLMNACQTIEYKNYDIFVGVYPNDPKTLEKVEEVSRRFPNVHAVVAANDGPTTKADNLNHIHQGMLIWENMTGVRYDIILMHDAEDVIHPMSLKVNNALIPEYDMVQMPVLPLHTSHAQLVHWSYADEFAEAHTKDLLVRQHFSGFVPSAGVGTAFNRWLVEFVGTSYARNIFRVKSMTEDYDLSLRLALGHASLLFAYKPYGLNIATRAYFPHTMRTAIVQKSRWILGICLQSWKTNGWKGDSRIKFILYRDRKAVVANIINFMAYFVIAELMMYETLRFTIPRAHLMPIVDKGTWLWDLVVFDSFLMFWRIFHRYLCARRIYGTWAGVLSIVRLPISNIINFTATGRALVIFVKSVFRGKDLKWEKTAHRFPNAR
jgi:adsorption protein B